MQFYFSCKNNLQKNNLFLEQWDDRVCGLREFRIRTVLLADGLQSEQGVYCFIPCLLQMTPERPIGMISWIKLSDNVKNFFHAQQLVIHNPVKWTLISFDYETIHHLLLSLIVSTFLLKSVTLHVLSVRRFQTPELASFVQSTDHRAVGNTTLRKEYINKRTD